MIGALVGAAFGCGVLLVWSAVRRARRPSPSMRVDPYLGDVLPEATRGPASTVGAVYGPWFRSFADAVSAVTGGSSSVQKRLVRLGSPFDVEDFRVQQLVWGALGFGAAAVASTIVWTTYCGSPRRGLLHRRARPHRRRHRRRRLELRPAAVALQRLDGRGVSFSSTTIARRAFSAQTHFHADVRATLCR